MAMESAATACGAMRTPIAIASWRPIRSARGAATAWVITPHLIAVPAPPAPTTQARFTSRGAHNVADHQHCAALEIGETQTYVCVCKKCGIVLLPEAIQKPDAEHLCHRCYVQTDP